MTRNGFYIAKLQIALKQCSEGGYCYINDIFDKCIEVKKLLVASINAAKRKRINNIVI